MSTAAIKRRNVRKKALCVGIDKYANPANILNGCVADSVDMAETLKITGFPRTKIKLLIDEHATYDGIIAGLDWLTKDAYDGDVLVFSYSGHGSQVTDLDNDETDGYDEVIIPQNFEWEKRNYITDDVLYNYFSKKVPVGVRVDVVLDSCFSGTATRSLTAENPSQRTAYTKQRYIPPPQDHAFKINTMIPQFTRVNTIGDKSVLKTQNNSLWSACQEWQTAWELDFDGQIRGAFTYYLTRILRRSNGNLSRAEIYEILRPSMYNDGYSQIPNLETPNPESLNLFPFRKERDVDRASEVKPPKQQQQQG